MKNEKNIISLNSKILELVSIEELEERLELSGGWLCDCGSYTDCPCYAKHSSCYPVNELGCEF